MLILENNKKLLLYPCKKFPVNWFVKIFYNSLCVTIYKIICVGIKAQNNMLGLRPLSRTAELSEEKQVVIKIPQ